ncbi:MAG TPA: DUF354 domain-containing protein [Candidatus Paceibacterota bacterium]|nr:DUF354 domain-containing protein [Candidatus Paceibacterota bacterium]
MFRNRLYYYAKPYLPFRVRLALRRWYARSVLRRCGDVWPIKPGSEKPPVGWPGWPDSKQFAVVLTHDVEGQRGLDRVKQLAELEMKLGFRSSFNFVPEGEYTLPTALRSWLVGRGFEVGVHDLHHDGRLYRSREEFRRHAQRINHYLREWGAVGFRSGFMLHNLDWLHDLDIEYDASTFDTDPFEPQPDGVGTIFPFWVPRSEGRDQKSEISGQRSEVSSQRPAVRSQRSEVSGQRSDDREQTGVLTSGSADLTSDIRHLTSPALGLTSDLRPLTSGYVELPYTLIQDFNLFVVLRARTAEFWRRKIEWIATHGGMVHFDTHPDYVAFGPHAPRAGCEFDANRYLETLAWLRDKFTAQYWHALPKEAAALARPASFDSGADRMSVALTHVDSHARSTVAVGAPQVVTPRDSASPGVQPARHKQRQRKIWIDLDNTPHVPFFCPIIRELERRGHEVVLTARDAFQVCEMADLKGLRYRRIGRHYGRNRIAKVYGLFYRAAQLLPFVLEQRPHLAVSHGARSQVLISNLLRIPTVLIADYEYAQTPPLLGPKWEVVPDAIPDASAHARPNRILRYPGIKEDVYAWTLEPDPTLMDDLGIRNGDLVVVVRPPATEAHYHNPESETLFAAVMDRLTRHPEARVVLLPRNQKQTAWIRSIGPQWFASNRVVIPQQAIDGMNLLWHADLVVSGGGTMNREAAALGVPVYSIFRGPIGAVDTQLAAEGRLTLISSVEQIDSTIAIVPRNKARHVESRPRPALDAIVRHIEALLPMKSPTPGQGTRPTSV